MKELLKVLLKFFIVAAILGLAVMLLWNCLMPEIFGLGKINYLQAAALYVFCDILFRPSNSNNKND